MMSRRGLGKRVRGRQSRSMAIPLLLVSNVLSHESGTGATRYDTSCAARFSSVLPAETRAPPLSYHGDDLPCVIPVADRHPAEEANLWRDTFPQACRPCCSSSPGAMTE
jgi:hypothetical protein